MVQRLKSPSENSKSLLDSSLTMFPSPRPNRSQDQYWAKGLNSILMARKGVHHPSGISLVESSNDHITETEYMIANDMAKYVVLSLNYFLFSPRKIRFDEKTRRFTAEKRSCIRMVINILCQVIITTRLIHRIGPHSELNPQGSTSSVKRYTYLGFLIYCYIYFGMIWFQTKNCVRVLNKCIDLAADLSLGSVSLPKPKLIRYISLASWSFPVIFCAFSHLLPGLSAIAYHIIKDKQGLPPIFGYDNASDARFAMNEFTYEMNLPTKIYLVVSNFLNTYTWMASFLHTGIWALVLRQMFMLFLWRFEAIQEHGLQMDLANVIKPPEEIRTFNSVAHLVDLLNNTNSPLIFGGSFIAVVYISTSIEQAFSAVTGLIQLSYRIYLYMSFVPLVGAILMVSDLHRVASSFGNRIKDHFGKWKDMTTPSSRLLYSTSMVEALHGLAIVHHDIVSSNIGFKGFGFFTITYKFVATMVSLTVTYTITAIQMFHSSSSS